MRVTILRFGTPGPLTRAFDQVLESPDVASCMIESDQGRIRFVAPADVADRLVERIYEGGGLVWCSHHDLVKEDVPAQSREELPRGS